jgi:dethiobiotin synthetase
MDMKKIFVTGIGTDIGKTVVSAVLVEALKADYWKPVQTGSFFSRDTVEVKRIITNTKSQFHPESYLLKQPMSPHAAAELEGVEIQMDQINLPETSNHLVIEGAGGLMVPLNRNYFMIDLIQKFDAEVILVVKNYLGSINHTLLSIDVLKSRGLKIMGIVINEEPHALSENIILQYSGLKLLGRIEKEGMIKKEVIEKYAKGFEWMRQD